MSYVQNNQILGPQHHTLLYGIISKETTKYNYNTVRTSTHSSETSKMKYPDY